jgi:hypothetical protein
MSEQMLVVGVAIVTLATAFAGAVRFLVKHYLSELRPDGNGNHNLRGRVERIELRVDEIYRLLLERNG